MDKELKYRLPVLAAVVSIVAFAIGCIFVKNPLHFGWGILFGSLTASLMFWQTFRSVEKAVSLSPAAAQRHIMLRYFARMIVYAAVLFASIKAEHIHLIGVLIGLSSIKISVLLIAVMGKRKKFR